MCHEDKQQSILVAKPAASEFGGKRGVLNFFKQFLSLFQQRLVGLLVIVFLVHQPVETVEKCLRVRHRFRLVNVRLILTERFQHNGRYTIAERLAASRSPEIVLGFKHVNVIGESQNLCGATTGVLGGFRNHDAAVLAAVNKHGQQHYLHSCEF